MEMVASVKMQKAVKSILTSRRYIQNAWNLLARLSDQTTSTHPLLQTRDVRRVCLILVTSDRGLAGSYNADVTRKLIAYLKELNNDTIPASSSVIPVKTGILDKQDPGSRATGRDDKGNRGENRLDIIAIGKKGSELVRKLSPQSLIAEFPGFDTGANFEAVTPIAKIAIDGYIAKKYDQVIAIYSHFQSSIKQTPVKKQILPIAKEHIDLPDVWEQEETSEIEYKFEPSVDIVLERVVPQFIRAQIYGVMLEAAASEQSARMVAMKNATDNARDLIDDLTLTYNSIRQDSITREIAEISGAAEAMK